MTTRREKIEAMLQDEPNDQFLRYSLAMEFSKEDNHERSLGLLTELIEDNPPHVPAFFMAGQQLAGLGQINKARDVLRAGIDVARQQGNQHAAGEMSEFLISLGGAGE
ncbi:tetratricopeptide repeat protein [Aeoliella mucimassa]|uniref:Uncharacterized protein n=1 Tax=Aeoliella mucimassa TaxID=2527972 RepID=A0A518AM63_9BACT|nr:hypothetical protein [Aeoliella mucimassa]QDU55813.1 hypothetical protein Pan181_20090 [Aeoliella mucimassa]